MNNCPVCISLVAGRWESGLSGLRATSGCVMWHGSRARSHVCHMSWGKVGVYVPLASPGEYVTCAQRCPVPWLWDRLSVPGSVWRGVFFWASPTSRPFSVTIGVAGFVSEVGEGSGCVAGVIAYWSHFSTGGRSSNGLFTVPPAAKEAVLCRMAGVAPWLTGGCVCQDSMAWAAGLALSSPSTLGTCSSCSWVPRRLTDT